MTDKSTFWFGSFGVGCFFVFGGWALPSFVSHGTLAPTVFLIGGIIGFLAGLSAWHRDQVLTRATRGSAESAEVILEKCRRNGSPYAVYLRSFDYERLQNPLPIPLLRVTSGSARRVEIELVQMLTGRLPILALSDPAYPFSMPGAYRFSHLTAPWPMFLERLLEGSSLIIIYMAEYNPGLVFEIGLVRELDLTHKSLVILKNGNLKSFPEFRWVTKEKAPYLENTLNALLQSLDKTRSEGSAEASEPGTSAPEIPQLLLEDVQQSSNQLVGLKVWPMLKLAVQVLAFLLPLVLAFGMWGMPNVLLAEYWRYDMPLPEIRKLLDDRRKAAENFGRQLAQLPEFLTSRYKPTAEWKLDGVYENSADIEKLLGADILKSKPVTNPVTQNKAISRGLARRRQRAIARRIARRAQAFVTRFPTRKRSRPEGAMRLRSFAGETPAVPILSGVDRQTGAGRKGGACHAADRRQNQRLLLAQV